MSRLPSRCIRSSTTPATLDWEKTVSADGVFAEYGIPLVAVTPRQISERPQAVLVRIERAHQQAAQRPRPPVIARRLTL
jgi:hypothetical protein